MFAGPAQTCVSASMLAFDSREEHKAPGVSFCGLHALPQPTSVHVHNFTRIPQLQRHETNLKDISEGNSRGKLSPSRTEAQRVMRRSTLVLEDMAGSRGWRCGDADSSALSAAAGVCRCLAGTLLYRSHPVTSPPSPAHDREPTC